MSYRYSSGGGSSDSRRYSSSSRRDSPPRHSSSSSRRRSPSPGPSRSRREEPRDPKLLPEAFGRVSIINMKFIIIYKIKIEPYVMLCIVFQNLCSILEHSHFTDYLFSVYYIYYRNHAISTLLFKIQCRSFSNYSSRKHASRHDSIFAPFSKQCSHSYL